MNWNEIIFFSAFLAFILFMLFVDLILVGKKSHIVSFKESISWTIIWVSISMLFYVIISFHGNWIHGIDTMEKLKYFIVIHDHSIHIDGLDFESAIKVYNHNLSLEYLTGYLIEYALSIDNVFVIILIFISFNVQQKFYKRVLFWGIIGAIVMRFIFIFLSATLIQEFEWILYLFGLLLIFTGVKMFLTRNKEEKMDAEKHPVVKFASKYFAVYPRFVQQHFVIKKNRKTYITPLLIVLLVIEFTDVIFAVDSVPAIFSVTKDPYIVFFSNIFAIIGLRSLFFLLSNIMNKFRFLKVGLAALLTFIGLKMLFNHWLKDNGFTTAHSLYVVLGILSISVIASLLIPEKKAID
ncbi:MAG: TerC/Alx family metal homeostasis membrane protein [Bacteroidetes bacterium]|nr:TerC/Alx family metal homeostasis membrane protein [Bacteroidota bacterium]